MTVPSGMTPTMTGVASQSAPRLTSAQPEPEASEALTVMSASVVLSSSTKSSLPPFGPFVRSSEMMTGLASD